MKSAYNKIPREKLTTMCVAGKLKIELLFTGIQAGTGLMRQQHADIALRCTGDRSRRIGSVRRQNFVRSIIIHARHHQLSRAAANDGMGIVQDIQSKFGQRAAPRFRAGIILVITGHKKRAIRTG